MDAPTTTDLFYDFCWEQCEITIEGPGGAYKTKDGVGAYLSCALSCSPVYYSENSWNDWSPEVRCDMVVIAYTSARCNRVVIAPYGKDNHCHMLDEQQLDDYIAMLQLYRKYMGKL